MRSFTAVTGQLNQATQDGRTINTLKISTQPIPLMTVHPSQIIGMVTSIEIRDLTIYAHGTLTEDAPNPTRWQCGMDLLGETITAICTGPDYEGAFPYSMITQETQ